MKKILSLVLCVAMMLTMLAAFAVTASAEGPIKVDIFFYDFSDTYLGSVRAAMEEQLKGMADKFTYTIYDGAKDQAKQTEQVDTAIISGSQLLIVNVVTTGSVEAAQNIVNAAKEKDIPVIFFNREVDSQVVASYDKCAFVGTDADEAGYMQGQMIAEFLLAEGNMAKYDLNKDNEISYLMFRGELGNAEAYGRTKYSVTKANELLAASGVKLSPSKANQVDNTQEDDGISPYFLYGNWSPAIAKDLMDTALITYGLDNGDIEIIIANNDDQALGTIESMNEKGYNTGDAAKYIPVFGVDATAVAQDAIKNAKMTGTIKQDAIGMATTILALAQNVQGGAELMAGTDTMNVDEGVAKIRVPYAIYTGE